MCTEVTEWQKYLDSLQEKINNNIGLNLQEALDAVDASLIGEDGTMSYKNLTDGTISPEIRDVKKELNGLKLNIRISQNPAAKNVLDVNLYNHSKHIHYMKIADEGYTTDIFEMYKQQYEISLYSQSRLNAISAGAVSKLTDDFDVCIQGYNPVHNATFGEWFQINDITYVDDAVISGEGTVDNKSDAKEIGVVNKWAFCRTKDKTEYFFKKGSKFITGKSIQTAVEKYVLSSANTTSMDINAVKEALGIGEVKFANDLTITERQSAVRTDLEKLAKDTTEDYEDYLARIAITAMRELSATQRKAVYDKIESYAKDPEKEIEEELEVAV